MNYETFVLKDNNESNVNSKNNDELANKLRHAYSEILNTNSNKSFKRQLSFQKSSHSLNKNNYSTNQDNNNITSEVSVETNNEKFLSVVISNNNNSKNNNGLIQNNISPVKSNVISSFRKFKITPTDESTIDNSFNRNYANTLRESSRKLLIQNISNKKPSQMSKEIMKENGQLIKDFNERQTSSENAQKVFEYNLQYISSEELANKETIFNKTQCTNNIKVSNQEDNKQSSLEKNNISNDSISNASKNYLHRKEKLQSAKIDLNQIDNQLEFEKSALTSNPHINKYDSKNSSISLNTLINDSNSNNRSKSNVNSKDNSRVNHNNNKISFDPQITSINDDDQSDRFYQMPQMIDIDSIYDSSMNSMDLNNSNSTQSSLSNFNDYDMDGNSLKSKAYLDGIPGFDRNLPPIIIKPILKIQTNKDNNSVKSNNANNKSKKIKLDPISVILDAACEGDIHVISEIFKQMNDVSVANRLGATPLHLSICSFKYEATKLLIDLGADVNYSDINGWTPLHCAAFYCDLWTCKLLVSSGANVRATTLCDNKTPVDICRSKTFKDFNNLTTNDKFIPVNDCLEFLIEEMDKLQQLNIGSIVYSCYDHHKNMEDELTIFINDKLVMSNHPYGLKEPGWIWVENSLRQCGFIPDNYISKYPKVQTDV